MFNKKSNILYAILLGWLFFNVQAYAADSPYDAARNGELDALRQYRFESIDLFIPDERGFIPYELAALHADPADSEALRKRVEIMLWLKEYKAKNHRYGKSSIALVQAGLNALGANVGQPDGMLGKKTFLAIKAFQRDHELAETGTLGPHWLGYFYRELLKDMQFKLTKLGYNTGGTDGIIGDRTRQSIVNFRTNKSLEKPNYKNLDALLVTTIDNTYLRKKEKEKSVLVEKVRQKNKSEALYLQAGLRTLGYRVGKVDGHLGSRTSNALKSFQKKYSLKVTGEVDSKTKAKMDNLFLKETQRKLNALGYKVGHADGQMGAKTKKGIIRYRKNHNIGTSNALTSALIVSVDNNFDAMQAKLNKKKRAKKSAVVRKKKAVKKSKTKKVATSKTNVKSNKKNKKKVSNDVVKKVASGKKLTHSVNAREAAGRMSFNRKNGRVVGCSLAGRKIPIEWCEPFYPLPKKNHCEASFKPSGAVVNLWCK